MTFSIAARCPESGMFGIAIATSSIAVGNRCPWARAGVGAVTTQYRSDIRLGPLGLELLAAGKSARETVDALVAQSEFPEFRQVGVVDRHGGTAFHCGGSINGANAGAEGEGCVATGNVIAHDGVPRAIVAGYEAARGMPFAERLLAGVDAGLAAGGETQPIMSAALLIVDKQDWPLVDLRVDHQERPLRALRRLWMLYEPEVDHYVTQVLRPAEVTPIAERRAAIQAAEERARALPE
ncbi:DUF1028 domain-containing protein [Neoroseomonas oryzicola]|uniref:DUF1028 domain-containing protein n=1 Tax=Neoroseomonas oryzicola TaxID=535904 RepID=A0A9X9WE93_9PROT|nr:DUF1028 domain-containing protein [Neoroseomonas oryzicola]MBR0658653.1 DUF1028 domain-containing protein [Neoroseomonas oryzicola]NKE17911.1 DUF1028 domain-containing protein [Neoroseomonas oryzicola]